MTELTLWHSTRTRSTGALWLIEELGADYEIKLLSTQAGDTRKPEFLKVNPAGKVPAITHKGRHLAELAAISLYLCDVYPDAGLAPAFGDPMRAEHYFWHVFRPGVLEPAMIAKTQGWIAERGMVGWGDFENAIERVELVLRDRPYLLGDDFSASDILVGGALGWLKHFGVLDDSDVLDPYIARIHDRPAAKKAMEIDAKLEESAS
ncbi:glutathione S-transferase [Marinicauda salina]|uniref:Glutathione S-transferase n=1 Tax=Marinicauda salina TaxID=2135793 RepID=A0A2U2BUB0_9PROT|nr:glutathione S-transferase [Marinicauda salina]PWE17626.1 glutathione S-transferase [Marinicauda salina]